MVPQTFEEWKHCIIHECKIKLTQEFAEERLAVYTDGSNPETQKFCSLYGEQHRQNIIQWYKQI